MNISPVTNSSPEARRASARRPGVRSRESQVEPSWSRRAVIAVTAALVIIAIAVLIGSRLPDATDADGRLSRWFADRRTPTWNSVTAVFSGMASTFVVIAVAAAVVAVEAVRRLWDGVRLLITAMTGEVLIFLSITALVDRPRPDVAQLDPAPPTSSFPSGHTMAALVLWTAIAVVATVHMWPLVLRVVARVLTMLMPAAVAVSRLYRGMHHPTDVMASVVIGTIWMVVVVCVFTKRRERQQSDISPTETPIENWSNRHV